MTRKLLAAAIIGALITGCAPKGAPPQPSPPPPEIAQPGGSALINGSVETPAPFPLSRFDDLEALGQALLTDRSVIRNIEILGRDLAAAPSPAIPLPTVDETLHRLADHLAAGGQPEPPAGVAASHVATAGEGIHIYNLGPAPDSPHGLGLYQRLFVLQQGAGGWAATPICADRSERVSLYERPGEAPLLLCEAAMGPGRPAGYASLYLGAEELIRLDQLALLHDVWLVDILPSDQAGPPPLRVHQYLNWFPGAGYRSAFLLEQVTLTWQGDEGYQVSRRAWLDNWAYRFARFDTLIRQENLQAAVREMATPPRSGLQAYLDKEATALTSYRGAWTHPTFQDDKLFVKRDDANLWYVFTFNDAGRILSVTVQTAPPHIKS